MLTFVTGLSGSGKTTQLLSLLDSARKADISVAGVICPAVFEGGIKCGIDALLLPEQRCLRLAIRAPETAAPTAASEDEAAPTTMWRFDEAVFAAINHHFDSVRAELLFVDELGPQELCYNRGYVSALSVLDTRSFDSAVVVVRPSLLSIALQRWGEARIRDVSEEAMLLTSVLGNE
jgi:nucleoside-triphosphatase THEP1